MAFRGWWCGKLALCISALRARPALLAFIDHETELRADLDGPSSLVEYLKNVRSDQEARDLDQCK
eukprot:5066836-Pyramimonas_sp.AAC.1